MADEIDIANDEAERILESQLSIRKPIGPMFTGHCHNCEEQVEHPRRFCDADCRDDYEARKKMEAQRLNPQA